jgi:hypothetical protein
MRKVNYGDWQLQLLTNKLISVSLGDESRQYDVPEFIEVQQESEYVFLQHEGGNFTQVKFEVDNFLVIDRFDSDGELITEVGAYVFGEDDE